MLLLSSKMTLALTRTGCRSFRTSHRPRRPVVLGIRREDPARIWERRCPLTVEAVESLVKEDGVQVLVQPCERRVVPMNELVKAGATPHATLSPAHIIMGIKEVPLSELLVNPVPSPSISPMANDLNGPSLVPRTHLMFSHTIKGQSYNMPLLRNFVNTSSPPDEFAIASLPTLIDWELMTEEDGKRICGFGWHAGVAGVLEGLIATAHMYLELGIATPFLAAPRPHTASEASLRASLRRIGDTIRDNGTPASMGPFVVCVTGSGRVASGALSIVSELPTQLVAASDVSRLVLDPATPLNQIYVIHAKQEDYMSHIQTGRYSRDDYYASPGNYVSSFHIAPFVTLLVNGVGWAPGYPSLMTESQLVSALQKVENIRQGLAAVGSSDTLQTVDVMKARCQSFADISCDVKGGLQFIPRTSTLSDPFYTHRPSCFAPNMPSLNIMAVDILPAALPAEATSAFSDAVLPFVKALVRKYKGDYCESDYASVVLERATVAKGGELTGQHAWLRGRLEACADAGKSAVAVPRRSGPPPRKVVLLGSGMVARPVVERLCAESNVELIVVSNSEASNRALTNGYQNASFVTTDLVRMNRVEEIIQKVDIVISLLPTAFHPAVADLCIKHRRHLVTASYISPTMAALHDAAVQAGVLLLNEIGLDPGLDHCSALALFDELEKQDKRITSFVSFCGGLPAPEHAEVPLHYKFSWSPLGVLRAVLNEAVFLLEGRVHKISSEHLLQSRVPALPVSSVLNLEGIPNRDSHSYQKLYSSEQQPFHTLFRGTIRYQGFCDLMYSFKCLGLLGLAQPLKISSWSELTQRALELHLPHAIEDAASLRAAIADSVPFPVLDEVLESLRWLEALPSSSRTSTLPVPPDQPLAPLELFAILLSHKLQLGANERDLVIMHHEVVATSISADSGQEVQEIYSASLHLYGTPGLTAMAKCVGLPVALATLKVLEDGPFALGVQTPTSPVLYTHILEQMALSGVEMKTRKLHEGEPNIISKLIATYS